MLNILNFRKRNTFLTRDKIDLFLYDDLYEVLKDLWRV